MRTVKAIGFNVRSGRGAADAGANGRKRGVGVLPEDGNRAEAHHDDESEHDGVFDRGRAIFLRQETNGELLQTCEHD